MNKNRLIVAVAAVAILVLIALTFFRNIKFAEEGTVQVVTSWGQIREVHTPADSWFLTAMPGQQSHAVTLRSFTETTTPRVTSRDNAALEVPISVTAASPPGLRSPSTW